METYYIYMPANNTCNHHGYTSNRTNHIVWKLVSTIQAIGFEDAFFKGNLENLDIRSLSVGDIIVCDGVAKMVKGRGFEIVEFKCTQSNN